MAGGGPAGGHRAACCMLAPARRIGRPALGHLGHLGHCFKLQAGASGRLALGHLGHCFLGDPNDPKHGHARHAGAKSLGHLGHFVTGK